MHVYMDTGLYLFGNPSRLENEKNILFFKMKISHFLAGRDFYVRLQETGSNELQY